MMSLNAVPSSTEGYAQILQVDQDVTTPASQKTPEPQNGTVSLPYVTANYLNDDNFDSSSLRFR